MTTTTMVAHKTLLLLSGYKLFLLNMQWAWHSPCMRILFTFRPTGELCIWFDMLETLRRQSYIIFL